MKRLIAVLLILGSLMTSSCYRSSAGVGSGSKKATSEKPLAGVAESKVPGRSSAAGLGRAFRTTVD